MWVLGILLPLPYLQVGNGREYIAVYLFNVTKIKKNKQDTELKSYSFCADNQNRDNFALRVCMGRRLVFFSLNKHIV